MNNKIKNKFCKSTRDSTSLHWIETLIQAIITLPNHIGTSTRGHHTTNNIDFVLFFLFLKGNKNKEGHVW
jgi:hypothetical protein